MIYLVYSNECHGLMLLLRPDPNYAIIWIYGYISVMQQEKKPFLKATVHVKNLSVFVFSLMKVLVELLLKI